MASAISFHADIFSSSVASANCSTKYTVSNALNWYPAARRCSATSFELMNRHTSTLRSFLRIRAPGLCGSYQSKWGEFAPLILLSCLSVRAFRPASLLADRSFAKAGWQVRYNDLVSCGLLLRLLRESKFGAREGCFEWPGNERKLGWVFPSNCKRRSMG